MIQITTKDKTKIAIFTAEEAKPKKNKLLMENMERHDVVVIQSGDKWRILKNRYGKAFELSRDLVLDFGEETISI